MALYAQRALAIVARASRSPGWTRLSSTYRPWVHRQQGVTGRYSWQAVSHRLLGMTRHVKGEAERATVHNFEIALRTGSFDWRDELHSIHLDLERQFLNEDRFDKTRAHAKSPK